MEKQKTRDNFWEDVRQALAVGAVCAAITGFTIVWAVCLILFFVTKAFDRNSEI